MECLFRSACVLTACSISFSHPAVAKRRLFEALLRGQTIVSSDESSQMENLNRQSLLTLESRSGNSSGLSYFLDRFFSYRSSTHVLSCGGVLQTAIFKYSLSFALALLAGDASVTTFVSFALRVNAYWLGKARRCGAIFKWPIAASGACRARTILSIGQSY